MQQIPMVDLRSQYDSIKSEIDNEIQKVFDSAYYIGGPQLSSFQENIQNYLGIKHAVPCANGTDALQIALMALDLERGDEVIVPSFTYVATAEVIALLGLKPIMIDVDYNTFNITPQYFKDAISENTKAIIPVHLFGQCTEMDQIIEIANDSDIKIIEDNAQSIGAVHFSEEHGKKKAGTLGHISTTSFYPSKNLGCYGDGGAIFTDDDTLAKKLRMIANHGQEKRYYHSVIGCNSRLDAIQAAVLNVKLQYLEEYHLKRNEVAEVYDKAFLQLEGLEIPERSKKSTHVFHQYTVKIMDGKRDAFKEYLASKGISSMIYYPVPLYKQKAFSKFGKKVHLENTERLCEEVISLPIHTEMKDSTLDYIIDTVCKYFL
jgi:dTDP-4-amino-4,6-dideoxygalactose transaminase